LGLALTSRTQSLFILARWWPSVFPTVSRVGGWCGSGFLGFWDNLAHQWGGAIE
jgi:hypothetical protein